MRVDIHSHLVPRCFWEGVATRGHWYGATVERAPDGEFVRAHQRRAGPVTPAWRATPEERIREMDALGVDVHVLSTAPFFFNYHLEPAEALQASRELNDEIAAIVRAHPARFAGLATVPLQDAGAAAEELARAMEQGLKGAEVCTHVNGRNYDDPAFRPFFAAAERLGAFLFFHPHSPTAADRLGRYYLGNLIGNPLETTITIASLVFGGVLDRYPGLKLCFAHGGGYACYGIGRMDHGYAVRPEPRAELQRPPGEYLRRCTYDCIVHSHRALHFLLDTVGPESVLLGSDYPFDMGYADPVGWLLEVPGLSEGVRAQVLGGNAARLLGLGEGVPPPRGG